MYINEDFCAFHGSMFLFLKRFDLVLFLTFLLCLLLLCFVSPNNNTSSLSLSLPRKGSVLAHLNTYMQPEV